MIESAVAPGTPADQIVSLHPSGARFERISSDAPLGLPVPAEVVPGSAGDVEVRPASGDPYFLSFAAGDHYPHTGERLDPRMVRQASSTLRDGRPALETYGFAMLRERITPERIRALESLGARVLGFHPYNCLKVAVPVVSLDSLAHHEDVRWLGLAQPWQKVHPEAQRSLREASPSQWLEAWVNVFESDLGPQSTPVSGPVLERAGSSQAAEPQPFSGTWNSRGWMHDQLTRMGVEVLHFAESIDAFRVRILAPSVSALVELDFVQFIELAPETRLLHDHSMPMVNADATRSQFSGGTNQRAVVAIADTGVRIDHVALDHVNYIGFDLSGPTPSPFIDNDGHGSHVCGTVYGSDAARMSHRGAAPGIGYSPVGAVVIAKIFSSGAGYFDDSQLAYDLSQPLTASGITTPPSHVANHSWGDGPGAWLGSEAGPRIFDGTAFQSGQLHVFAAGNDGPDATTLSSYASAKNVLSVGSALDTPAYPSPAGSISYFSSRGPTGDSRWKPNVVAPGSNITSVNAFSVAGYASYSGTSMAAPHVTGLAAQLVDRSDFFAYRPEAMASVLMATALPKSDELFTSPSAANLRVYGAGRVDAARAHFGIGGTWSTWGFSLDAGHASSMDFTVPAGATRLIAVMHYVEQPASAGAGIALVNNWDMWLDAPPLQSGSATGDYSSHQSARDNTEIRMINAPAAGTWRLKLHPTGTSSRAHFGVTVYVLTTPAQPQFSLTLLNDRTYIQPGEEVNLTATAYTAGSAASGVFLDSTSFANVLVEATVTMLDGTVVDILGNPYSGRDVVLGNLVSSTFRQVRWKTLWPTEGRWTWSIAGSADAFTAASRSVQIFVDSTPPAAVSGLASPSHSISGWSSDSTIEMAWQAAYDSNSGIDGYSVQWANSAAAAVPDTTKDIEQSPLSMTSPPLSDGPWYFGIRAVDNCGNWSTSHVVRGPYGIDTQPPSAPGPIFSSSHPPYTVQCSTLVSMQWTPASDSGSGIAGYIGVFDQSTNTEPTGAANLTAATTSLVQDIGSLSGWRNFHLRAVDAEGNLGPTVHFYGIGADTCACGGGGLDGDGDGVPNCSDGCPNDPLKTAPGACGCGAADVDSDLDGTLDCNDGCPTDPLKVVAGACGCGFADTDSDGDGVADCIASGRLDPSFGTQTPGFVGAYGEVRFLQLQPDGKVLAAGRNVQRFHPQGSIDKTFALATPTNGSGVMALALQPDGKLLVGGDFTSFNGATTNRLLRLNAAGNVDATFLVGSGIAGQAGLTRIRTMITQPDGKVLIAGSFTSYNGTARNNLLRILADGSLDTAFQIGTGPNGEVFALALQPDGKIVLGGAFTSCNGTTRNRIARLNADGSVDTSFNPGTGASSIVQVLALQNDGKILLGGRFATFNGVARSCLARIGTTGALDTAYDPGTGLSGGAGGVQVAAFALQQDGKLLVGGDFTFFNGIARNNVARVNANGVLDTSYDAGVGPGYYVQALCVLPGGDVLVGGSFSTFQGVLRSGLARTLSGGLVVAGSQGANAEINAMALQSNGRILIAGDFTSFSGVARNRIARLLSDGSLDLSFAPGAGADNTVSALALQPDGKILIAGKFTSYNGTARNGVARLLSTGALDTTFNPGTGVGPAGTSPGVLYALALQPDGKLIVGGRFGSFQGTVRRGMARLLANGSLDTSFQSGIASTDDYVFALQLQPDGKLLLGGIFATYGGFTRRFVARALTDGTCDTSFNNFLGIGDGTNGTVRDLALLVGGKVLLGGDFGAYNGTARGLVARANADGLLDPLFVSSPGAADFPGTTGVVADSLQQPDGRVVIGGRFRTYNGALRQSIARIQTNGAVDASFHSGLGANGTIKALALQPDGRILVAGSFTLYDGSAILGIARINGDNCTVDSDGDGVANCLDGCPIDPLKTVAGACGCGVVDSDADGDGTADCSDGCPTDPLKTVAGQCGCGVAESDTDLDGTSDCLDGCPLDPTKSEPGICGCGVADTDSDGDTTPDCNDGCPNDSLKLAPGPCGCGLTDADSDNDGVPNCFDGCPLDPSKLLPGACGCGVPDADSDFDGVANCIDGCPNDPGKTVAGTCGCGVAETDSDGDGAPNCVDGCPNDPLKIVQGICGCGVADTDTDGDGAADCFDNCAAVANPAQADCDLDGVGDACELATGSQLDTNANGLPDSCEPGVAFSYCTAGTTTNGCTSSIAAVGTPSASASSGFLIVGTAVEGQKQALLYYGVNGPTAQPWAPGSASFKCVRQPVQRCTTQNSGGTANSCNGSYSLDLAGYLASRPSAIGNPLFAGEVFNAQLWFRDPPAPSTSSLSNALQFTLAP